MKYKSVSVYTVLIYLSKFLFLLIIPLIQQILLSITGIREIIYTLWPSIIIVGIIFFISFIKYKSVKYSISKEILFVKKGFLIKKRFIIPIKNINAIDRRCTILSSIFNSERVSFYLNTKCEKINALNLRKGELKDIFYEDTVKKVIKSKPIEILFMAISWSNPAISLLIAVPYVNKLGKIVGEETTKRLYSTMNTTLRLIKIGIPPLIASISYLLLGTFFIAVIIHFFKYANFTTIITTNNIVVSNGLISENHKTIRKDRINALVIKQSLFMIVLKVYSIYAGLVGAPKTKGEYNLLFASLKKRDVKNVVNELYGNNSDELFCVKPHKKRIINFLLFPIVSFLNLIFSVIIFLQDKWYDKIIIFSLFFVTIFILWWIMIRCFAYKYAGVSVSKGILNINGFKWLSLYYGVIPVKEIQSICIERNPFFRWSNLCKFKVKTYSEKDNKFICKYLDYSELKKLLNLIN